MQPSAVESAETMSPQVRGEIAGKEGKYLTFGLGSEEYGLEILKVKEIIGVMNITSVPQTPKYVKGVINFSGKVISVIDLRPKFGMDAKEYNERTCIIVVDIAVKAARRRLWASLWILFLRSSILRVKK